MMLQKCYASVKATYHRIVGIVLNGKSLLVQIVRKLGKGEVQAEFSCDAKQFACPSILLIMWDV